MEDSKATKAARESSAQVVVSKCDSTDCDSCGPLRSRYRDVLGGRFLPAVVPFVQSDSNPGLQPAEPGTAAARFFPDVFAVRSLYPKATSVPRELFLPRRLNANFEELKCPFGCETVFPTKAAVQRHRVRMHKFKRVGKPAQPTQEEKQDYVPLFEDVSEILKRANSDSAEFVVATTYNTFEWRTLPLDHDKVKDFLSKVPEDSVIMPYGLPLVNLQAWVSGGVLVEDDEQIDDMTDE